ncbi:MAG TPA: 4Fe-4S ferredoxin [Ruminococcaceae bacterium]|nr:4Fe-4S ferredoxin [Oscillospiraceae bacterium]
MTIFYFSATGNSLYVAKEIGGTLYSIPQCSKNKESVFEDDAIGFVFPCYGFGIPNLVKHFIEHGKFKAAYFFAVTTYGNTPGNCMEYTKRAAQKAGFSFDYCRNILMIDNYLPVFRIEQQLEKEPQKNIPQNLKQIVSDIHARKKQDIHKGLGTSVMSSVIQSVASLRKGDVDKRFWVNDNCTKCGTCRKVCPKGNISIAEKPVYHHQCDFCLACINFCPQKAIQLKGQKSGERFSNPHIKTAEIIAANNQFKD